MVTMCACVRIMRTKKHLYALHARVACIERDIIIFSHFFSLANSTNFPLFLLLLLRVSTHQICIHIEIESEKHLALGQDFRKRSAHGRVLTEQHIIILIIYCGSR